MVQAEGTEKSVSFFMAKMGRPPSITETEILKLEQCFRVGATVLEACEEIGVSQSTFYDHLKANQDFADRISIAKEYVTEFAKALITRRITERKDVETAKWWVERKNKKEFSPRTEVSGPDGESLKIEIIEDTTLKDANEDETGN